MSFYPASYWIFVSSYFLAVVIAIYFLGRRRDCFSCSTSAAIRRSILFAVIVTPTVIPGWVLTPIPASVFFITLVWALLYNPEFSAALFVQVTAVFVLLPIGVIVMLTFLGCLSLRRCRQRHPNSHASGL